MKALSLKQPWANWILDGSKTIETRKWNTSFRGKFLIHASKTPDKFIIDKLSHAGEIKTEPKGYLIGIASIVDVKKYKNRTELSKDFFSHLFPDWYPSNFPIYGFILEDVKAIKPISYKGMLNFFETEFTTWDIRLLESIEYLKCRYCEYLNELERNWRSIGDDDDTHYIICENCKKNIAINNLDLNSEYLVKGK